MTEPTENQVLFRETYSRISILLSILDGEVGDAAYESVEEVDLMRASRLYGMLADAYASWNGCSRQRSAIDGAVSEIYNDQMEFDAVSASERIMHV